MKLIEPRLRTLPALLERNAAEDPDRAFLIDGSETLSRAQVWELAKQIAAGFLGVGLMPGDRVGIMLENSREFVLAWFGLATAALVEVPLNPALRGDRLIHAVNHSGAPIVVVHADYVYLFEELADQLSALSVLVVVGDLPDTPRARFKYIPFDAVQTTIRTLLPTVSSADTVAIMYTSGSTGPAKGVAMPHGQHYMNGFQAARQAGVTAQDRVYIALPLHHNMAQGYGVMVAAVAGAGCYLGKPFKRATFWEDVIASESTVFSYVGSLLALLAAQDAPPSNPLRVAFGVPVPANLHEQIEERFGLRLLDGYGSTEFTMPAWGTLEGPRRIGSCGQTIPEFDVQIFDADGNPVPAGEVGEICIRTSEPNSVFAGYFNDPDRTTAALRCGWYHSGDRGHLDADGYLWFDGRIDDVIRRFGEFISAKEVEDVLGSHPGVELVAAFAIPSDIAGQEVMVAAVPKQGVSLAPQALRDFCTDQLPDFAVPRYIEIVDQLPMTPTGKIEKHKLRSRGTTDRTFDARAAWPTKRTR
jgi:carnitine-CoA ligase